MTAQILHFQPHTPDPPPKGWPTEPVPPPRPPVHWWWRVENIILTTLAIAYAVLVYGVYLKMAFQFLSRIF